MICPRGLRARTKLQAEHTRIQPHLSTTRTELKPLYAPHLATSARLRLDDALGMRARAGMPVIFMRCPTTGATVGTWQPATRVGCASRLDFAGRFRCSYCDQGHAWTKADVGLAEPWKWARGLLGVRLVRTI